MDALYREAILDHYKHPRRKGHLENPDIQHHDHNPFCGDEITIQLKVVDDIVVDAAFDGRGCAISQATASMLMEELSASRWMTSNNWIKRISWSYWALKLAPCGSSVRSCRSKS